ncbi:aromatic ring-opening dioxygenase LigB [Pandoraea terrae]|uniref:Aromatic ring-opening dioxygenase LigB n=1 Tax=Pandoraea terrae TaxID=1537710 RepID=A0A5E4TZ08_9BURK|nr:class III extradiol ring-cleavage dioxygenase [Pandoraea terrae]VVD91099.1 aromatic ring-opening dioxygenase LigB [Pandoraea terrae]
MTAAALPSLYVSHGAPLLAIEPGRTGPLLSALGRTLPRPKEILVISPHWTTPTPRVGSLAQQRTIHDFGGFPRELYELQYPAAGAPALAERTAGLLRGAGLPAALDDQWGLDHGAWVPLRYLYPDADVPVTQLSLQRQQGPEYHYRVGQALAPLAREGVLILTSGSFTHNLHEVFRTQNEDEVEAPYLREFVAWFTEHMAALDLQALFDYRARAPHAQRAHPTDEHLLPIFVALGAADDAAKQTHFDSGSTFGVLRMDAFAFGSAAPTVADVMAA